MKPISFKRHRFPPAAIRQAVWLYSRFTLSLRDVEDLLAERGIEVSYESVRFWINKFGPAIAANIGQSRQRAQRRRLYQNGEKFCQTFAVVRIFRDHADQRSFHSYLPPHDRNKLSSN